MMKARDILSAEKRGDIFRRGSRENIMAEYFTPSPEFYIGRGRL